MHAPCSSPCCCFLVCVYIARSEATVLGFPEVAITQIILSLQICFAFCHIHLDVANCRGPAVYPTSRSKCSGPSCIAVALSAHNAPSTPLRHVIPLLAKSLKRCLAIATSIFSSEIRDRGSRIDWPANPYNPSQKARHPGFQLAEYLSRRAESP